MYPNYLLNPIINAVSSFFETTVVWDGYTVISSLGYWNGNAVMMVTMGVFLLPLIWLLFRVRAIKKVKQFNIVFAAERPDKPETTHFSYNFFAHYQKAIGFLITPVVTKFWNGVVEWTHSLAAAIRNIYTGNGETYALHILIYIVVIYFIIGIK